MRPYEALSFPEYWHMKLEGEEQTDEKMEQISVNFYNELSFRWWQWNHHIWTLTSHSLMYYMRKWKWNQKDEDGEKQLDQTSILGGNACWRQHSFEGIKGLISKVSERGEYIKYLKTVMGSIQYFSSSVDLFIHYCGYPIIWELVKIAVPSCLLILNDSCSCFSR